MTDVSTTPADVEAGYVNGSDLLLMVDGKCIGHCTSHKTTYSTETKEHSVKPVQSAEKTKALFKGKTVTSLGVSISFDGLHYEGEEENGFDALRALWYAGEAIEVKGFKRGSDETPYLSGNFILSSLDENAPAQDDATYSGNLENAGVVTVV